MIDSDRFFKWGDCRSCAHRLNSCAEHFCRARRVQPQQHLLEQLACNDEFLNFGCAFVNSERADFAIKAFD